MCLTLGGKRAEVQQQHILFVRLETNSMEEGKVLSRRQPRKIANGPAFQFQDRRTSAVSQCCLDNLVLPTFTQKSAPLISGELCSQVKGAQGCSLGTALMMNS